MADEAGGGDGSVQAGTIERWFESFLFASRWIAAPIYGGLAFGLVMLLAVFLIEVGKNIILLPQIDVHHAILAVLGLIDIALVTNLLLMVILVGYSHFVSKLDIGEGSDRHGWITREDFAGLKLKLFASIIGITGIELLKAFMEIRQPGQATAIPNEIAWLIGIHVTFLFTGLISAIADRLSQRSVSDDEEGGLAADSGDSQRAAPR
jgi:uncharacterized protein (TIGR00645 family)